MDVHPLLEVDGGELFDDGLGRFGIRQLLGDGDTAVGAVAVGRDVEVVGARPPPAISRTAGTPRTWCLPGTPYSAPFSLMPRTIVVAHPLSAGLQHLQGESATVLQAPRAVFVVAAVPHAGEEGVYEVVVIAVQLHAVETGFLGPLRGIRVLDDDLLDLRDGQRPEGPRADTVEQDLLGLCIQVRRRDRHKALGCPVWEETGVRTQWSICRMMGQSYLWAASPAPSCPGASRHLAQ